MIMLMTRDILLIVVRDPIIPISTLFTLERLKSFISRFEMKVKIPPPTRAKPKKKPTTFSSIEFAMIACTSEAAPENTIWKPQVVLAIIGSTFRCTRANIIVRLFARAKAPPLKPPAKAPRQMRPKYLGESRA